MRVEPPKESGGNVDGNEGVYLTGIHFQSLVLGEKIERIIITNARPPKLWLSQWLRQVSDVSPLPKARPILPKPRATPRAPLPQSDTER